MKTTKKLLMMALLIAGICTGRAHAQLITPTGTDVYWYDDTGYISWTNSAMIAYFDSSLNPPDTNWLMVEAYGGNFTSGGIVFTDRVYGTTFKWDYGDPANPYNSYIGGSPDIIVGNSATNPGSEFLVAAVYIERRPVMPPVVRYIMEFFTVTYTGPGTFTVTHTGNTVWVTGATGIPMRPDAIHIDIIAEAGNTGTNGFPWCDKYVVVWDDLADGRIFAWEGSLNGGAPATLSNTAAGVLQVNSPIVFATNPFVQPDVAAVERKACPTCSTEDWALVTYTDYNMGRLYYDELNLSTATIAPFGVWYGGNSIQWSRIDAPDDYNVNDPSSGNAYYKVCALVDTTSYTFDNLLGPFASWSNSLTYAYGQEGIPTIAYGPDNGRQYAVAHYSQSAFSGADDIFMEPIDWSNSSSLAFSPSAATSWFIVNTGGLNFVNGMYNVAISTPCNSPAGNLLVSWSTHDLSTGMSTVYYKTTPYGGANGYSFRPASVVRTENRQTDMQLYPNPAHEELILMAGSDATEYMVMDMLGRPVLRGAVTGERQAIDISVLTAGTYMLRVGAHAGNFVKL